MPTDLTADLHPMTAAPGDLEAALGLSRAAGWSFRLEDWSVAQRLGEGVLARQDGQVIGSALCWLYGAGFATLGSIIVAPAMQGRGLGRLLLARVLEIAGPRAVLLHATAEGLRLYQGVGFNAVGTVAQHMGKPMIAPAAASQVRRVRAEELLLLAAMDRRAFGAGRCRMIDEFLGIGTAAVSERGGVLRGFAVCRPFGTGRVIGPVVAADPEEAKALILHFLQAHAGESLRVDTSSDSGLGPWLTAQGLPEVGRVTTMLRGQHPGREGPERIFALASQSFG